MPPAMRYDPNDQDLWTSARDELAARRALANTAWKYYRGQHKPQLVVRPGEPNDNVVVNLVKQTVDRKGSFLVAGKMPRLEVELADGQDQPEVEKWLKAAWQATGGARLLAKLVKNGCLHGHVYARALFQARPRIVVLDPANVIAFWAQDDYEAVLWYSLYWDLAKTHYRQDIVRGEGRWAIIDYQTSEDGKGWTEIRRANWPNEIGPVVDWQHISVPNRFYGDSELDNLELNDRVNKVASDISKILRYHAAPRTVGTGFEAEDITPTAIDNLWTINDPNAKVFNLEMSSDLASSMNYLEFITRAYLAERRVVVLKGDVSDFQRVTNLGMRALFVDELAANDELRLQYELGLIRLSQILLALGKQPAEGEIAVHWPDPLPVDPLENVQVAEKERALGVVSLETVSRDLGKDYAEEQERMAEENTPEVSAIDRIIRGEGYLTPGPSMMGGRRGINPA